MALLVTRSIAATVMLAVLTASPAARAEPAWRGDFEGPDSTWREAGGNARHRVLQHQRVQGEAHTGKGCEWLRVQGEGGSTVYVSHDVGRPRVIAELAPTVWVKSDRPGLQFEARVVLPRTPDSRTGQPVTTLLSGTSYSSVGRWQQLRIDDLPRLLARQIRVLRTQLGPAVDGREAYLSDVLLNIYGGPGVTNVWIDDLEVAGAVPAGPGAAEPAVSPVEPAEPGGRTSPAGEPASTHVVRLVGSALLVDGRPFFPRIIQHQGEPLGWLRQLGFNAVWLARSPSPDLLDEVNRLGLWLVCPPPVPMRTDLPDEQAAALAPIGPQFGCVLAWDLGAGLSEEQLGVTKHWADQVRLADRVGGRPLICRPDSELRAYSRHVDLLLLDRRPLGTSLELADYAAWVRQQPRLARLGTPVWTTVQTQPLAGLGRQLAALDPGHTPPLVVASEQMRLLVYTAIAAGSRGLLALSDSPLSAEDPETRERAMSLELLNLELALMEPWAAAGSCVTSGTATEPEVTAAVLRTDRSHLLMPTWSAPGAQFVPSQSAANALSLVVPGISESTNAYELTPGGIVSLRHKRVTGGVRVTLDEFGLADLVLLAQDPLIINGLTRRAVAIGPRAAELQRHLAVRKLHVVEEVAGRLGNRTTAGKQAGEWLQAAKTNLQQCDARLAAKDYPTAYVLAQRSMRALRLIERAYWEKAVEGLPSPMSSPGTLSFATLPCHWRMVDRVAASRFGPNRLPGGDFEDLNAMLQAGWRHVQSPSHVVEVAADLIAEAARSGRTGLRLCARPLAKQPESAPAVFETPPAWITTAAVPVEAGQLVCIRGWVQIAKPISGSVDGLMIVDSLAGDDLALRISKTVGSKTPVSKPPAGKPADAKPADAKPADVARADNAKADPSKVTGSDPAAVKRPEWQQFTLFRASPQSGLLTVTFVLTGLGEVWLDDVSIQVLETGAIGGITQRPR